MRRVYSSLRQPRHANGNPKPKINSEVYSCYSEKYESTTLFRWSMGP
jgi:hypothetical protein